MPISAAIATAIGKTYFIGSVVASVNASRISPVAYETDDNASDAKTGSASTFGSSVCSSWWLEKARPSKTRLAPEPVEPLVWVRLLSRCYGPPATAGLRCHDRAAAQRWPAPGSVTISAGADAS